MIIYFALLIPLVSSFVLFKYFKIKLSLLEFLFPLLLSLGFIFGSKLLIEHYQVTSTEYWGSLIKRVEFYEAWDEWISKTGTETYGCDSKGNNCQTRIYDCSYSEFHPPKYLVYTTNNEEITINEKEYLEIERQFGNRNFVDLKRNFYTQNGNEYYSSWDYADSTFVSAVTLHTYENRIKVSDQSVFHFSKVSEEEIKKYDLKSYPEVFEDYKMRSVLWNNSNEAIQADKKLGFLNGLLGSKKQVRVFILVFENQPIQAALFQESLWSGGNKNEFVVCIGINKNKEVKWCKPFSWGTKEILKVNVKNFVQEQQKLDLIKIIDFLKPEVVKNFERRQFKEFSYLTVEPPIISLFFIFGFIILLNGVISYWLIKNKD